MIPEFQFWSFFLGSSSFSLDIAIVLLRNLQFSRWRRQDRMQQLPTYSLSLKRIPLFWFQLIALDRKQQQKQAIIEGIQQQIFPPAIPFSVSVKTLNLQLGQVVSIDSLDRISGKRSDQKIELDAMFVLLMFNSDKHFEFCLLNFILFLKIFQLLV